MIFNKYPNTKTGNPITNDANSTNSIALADLNGDSELDLIEGNDGINYWYKNTGSGVFIGTGIAITDDSHSTGSIKAADMDGDADLDVVEEVAAPVEAKTKTTVNPAYIA